MSSRTCVSTPASGPAAVAVGTHYVTFLHLLKDCVPGAVAQSLGDVEQFVSEVVELEDEWIPLAAVDAWMRLEEGDEVRSTLRSQAPFPPLRVVDVALAMEQVVLLFVRGATCAAVIIPLSKGSPAPCEMLDLLALPAATARPQHPGMLTDDADTVRRPEEPRCR
jgi:hypothetical protein